MKRLTYDERKKVCVKVARRWQRAERIADLAREHGVTHGTMTRWICDGRMLIAIRNAERLAR